MLSEALVMSEAPVIVVNLKLSTGFVGLKVIIVILTTQKAEIRVMDT